MAGREQLWRIWHYLHTQYGASEQDAIRIVAWVWSYYNVEVNPRECLR